jgi:quinoprotein dehydrogenase-associated probable ABC transporter substrate-binding protein
MDAGQIFARRKAMNLKMRSIVRRTVLVTGLMAASATAFGGELKTLTICADPGNMPLSNSKGEGFQNKIAEIIGKDQGIRVNYYWRPSIERGLMRTTLNEGNCDVWMDMATDTEGAVVLTPLYRSTFVLAYRSDKGIHIKDLNDPQLKKLRVGVFQVSAIRQALADHGVMANTVIQYLSHNGDLVEDNQPSYQVRQVIKGELDVAAVWGPMAGYFKSVKHEPLTLQPANLMDDAVPLEFDLALAVPRGRPDIKGAVEQALQRHKDEIKQVLTDFGVPLVKCDECLVSGDLPSHGPYTVQKPDPKVVAQEAREAAKARAVRMADLKRTLAQGGSADDELQNAVIASDVDRVKYTLQHGAHIDSPDGDGYTPLINATRFGFNGIAVFLLDSKANPNSTDHGGWTPLMYAAYNDNAVLIADLVKRGGNIAVKDDEQLTALAIAAQNDKAKAAEALLKAGADVNGVAAKGAYTPLMLAAISGSGAIATSLVQHGAKVNAVNPGGLTALMIAAANNNAGVAQVLLNSGADVNAKTEDGRTALAIAQSKNNETLVKLLQDASQHPASKSS